MNGVLNVLKPPAMTSSDVVSHVRRILGEKRVGHTGTLDPGAAGVLPVCVGRATKIADYIMRGDKEYIAQISFGIKTDTQDSYGTVTKVSECSVAPEDIKRALRDFSGTLYQRPPMYSAVKHEGKKLYELARRGIEVEKEPREVMIHEIEVLSGRENCYLLRIKCSKGTYIRTLCADIGEALFCGAHMSFLMRTETGGYRIEEAYTLHEIENLMNQGRVDTALIPMEDALGFMERIDCHPFLMRFLSTGTPVDLKKADIKISDHTDYAVYCGKTLIGIGKKKDETLKIVSMLMQRGEAVK